MIQHYDEETHFNWLDGPCVGMTWSEWAEAQGEMGDEADTATPLKSAPSVAEHIDTADNDNDTADNDNDTADNDNDNDTAHPTDHCSSPTVTHSVRRQLFGKSPKSTNSSKKVVTQNQIEPTVATPEIKNVAPQKRKTRAEKRAESESEEELDASSYTTPKKERRPDYWVRQNDLHIKRARALKQHREFIEVA